MLDKTVLVTGGSRGIGRAVVLEMARRGARVVFTYQGSEAKAFELKKQLCQEGTLIECLKADISDYQSCSELVEKAERIWGGIDVLVNNAGITKDRSLLMMPEADWNEVINTNLNGVYNVTKQCIFQMLKKKNGRVVNLSSISGITGLAGQANYSASKAGIIGFTRALAKEVASYGIAVNVVAPGAVETEMLDKLSQKEKDTLLAGIPVKRFCTADEVANVIAYLAFDSPLYLTGSVIVLDGGAGIG